MLFIPLKVHTTYSLCESTVKIDALMRKCRELQIPACGITDANNMFGVLDFSLQAASSGIQGIVGTQLNITFSSITAPILLFAKTECGYKNLLKLMKCFYFDNGVDAQKLSEYSSDLICLSGGYSGIVGKIYCLGQRDIAFNAIKTLHNLFKDNFYVEISRLGHSDESVTEKFFIQYAMQNNIPVVATNEIFFLNKEESISQAILMCINDGTYIAQDDRRKVEETCYLRNTEEMVQLFDDIPEAIANTEIIAKRCSFMPCAHKPILPKFSDNDEINEEEILKNFAINGLQKRIDEEVIYYPENKDREKNLIKEEYINRLNYEYSVIKQMGFCGYFLIVSDFINWAKNHGIPVGPGRGSGAGSIVSWSLQITDLDPIKYHLIFERFLNPERISMPDIDVDFCQYRRDEVIKYVQNRYGNDKVAHIAAFGKLQARAVLRDVGRVLQMPYGLVDRICKLVPQNPANPVDLKKALEIEPALTNMMEEDDSVKFLIQNGLALEGLYRHASVHAAGIVIGHQDVASIVPVFNDGETGTVITQFNMKYVEKAGLVKFDFLGLKTLTMIKMACDIAGINISKIPLDDDNTFALMRSGNIFGVFQLESAGMRDVLQKMQPDRLEDIIALVSLYRPGPMDDIPKYLARKNGTEPITYKHPMLVDILQSTYGVMVYQEQVMKIAQIMGGYTLAESDLLRRAMGKKIVSEMEKHTQIFLAGAKKNGVPEDIARDVFSSMQKFAGYGFNRSHAAPYALLSYQTAYLKANYPLAFYIASMNLDITNTERISFYIQDAKENGITILPPDINSSDVEFIGNDKNIRYALSAIKGISSISCKIIIEERQKNGKFLNIEDFFNRVKNINKRNIENFIYAGVFDSLNNNRHQVLEYYNKIGNEDLQQNQRSLFSNITTKIDVSNIDEWQIIDKLEKERGAIGFYLTSHPMSLYMQFLRVQITPSSEFLQGNIQQDIVAAGIFISKQEKLSRNKQKYAFLNISDCENSFEVSVLPAVYHDIYNMLIPGTPLLINISIKVNEGSVRLTATGAQNIDTILISQKGFITLEQDADIAALHALLEKMEDGDAQISFLATNENGRNVEFSTQYKKKLTIENRRKISEIRGVKLY